MRYGWMDCRWVWGCTDKTLLVGGVGVTVSCPPSRMQSGSWKGRWINRHFVFESLCGFFVGGCASIVGCTWVHTCRYGILFYLFIYLFIYANACVSGCIQEFWEGGSVILRHLSDAYISTLVTLFLFIYFFFFQYISE